jgi:chromosome segregation ATPase
MKEIKKDVFAFRRDIVVGAENAATGKTAAEKVIRYMEERVRDKDNQVNKLHDKNAHLRNELKRMKVQLSQKEEMGETLHTIDFDQLTIENQQFKEKIDERTRDLLKLKLTTGSTVTSLNNLKKQLNSLLTESDFLRAEITKQKQECTRLDRDIEKVTEDKALLERKNMTLKGQVRSAHVPQVTDYIQQKKDMYEMEQQIKSYERKVRVSEMATSKFRAKR